MNPDKLRSDASRFAGARGLALGFEEKDGLVYVTFDCYPIPSPAYDRDRTRLMIFNTTEYPKTAFDMFFTDPGVRLNSGRMPEGTSIANHLGGEWLQWSIHPYNDGRWDPGRDDLDGFMDYVERRFKNGD